MPGTMPTESAPPRKPAADLRSATRDWDIVFLDRDGTINERVDGYVDDPERLVLLPGAVEAVARLNDVLGTLASNPQIADMLSDPVVAQLLAQFVPPDWVGILIGLAGFALRSLRAVTSGQPEKPVRPGDNFTGA